MKIKNNLLVVFVLIVASCSDANKSTNLEVSLHDKPLLEVQIQPRPLPNPNKNAYYGDLHVHTKIHLMLILLAQLVHLQTHISMRKVIQYCIQAGTSFN